VITTRQKDELSCNERLSFHTFVYALHWLLSKRLLVIHSDTTGCNDVPDHTIRQHSCGAEHFTRDRPGVLLLQPMLYGGFLICVTISCNHGLSQALLHSARTIGKTALVVKRRLTASCKTSRQIVLFGHVMSNIAYEHIQRSCSII